MLRPSTSDYLPLTSYSADALEFVILADYIIHAGSKP